MARLSIGDLPAVDQDGDTNSDYGPEFTPEEEELLNELLLNISAEPRPAEAPVGDDEVPSSVRERRVLGRELLSVSYKRKLEGGVEVEVEVSIEGSGDSCMQTRKGKSM